MTITVKKGGEVSIQGKKLSVKTSGEVAIKGFMLVAAHAVAAGAPRLAARGPQAVALLAPLFADALDARALRLIAAELASVASPLQDREVLARLAAAIDSGRLVPVRVEPPRTWGVHGCWTSAGRPRAC